MKTRFKVENSKFEVELYNEAFGHQMTGDAHLGNHGFPIIPAVGDEIQWMSTQEWRVIRRVFRNRDGGRVELYLEPANKADAEEHRTKGAAFLAQENAKAVAEMAARKAAEDAEGEEPSA